MHRHFSMSPFLEDLYRRKITRTLHEKLFHVLKIRNMDWGRVNWDAKKKNRSSAVLIPNKGMGTGGLKNWPPRSHDFSPLDSICAGYV